MRRGGSGLELVANLWKRYFSTNPRTPKKKEKRKKMEGGSDLELGSEVLVIG